LLASLLDFWVVSSNPMAGYVKCIENKG